MAIALTTPPVCMYIVWSVLDEIFNDDRGFGVWWGGLPKAEATASQFGWMFSRARMVSISRASFSGVQSISFWPLGILVRGLMRGRDGDVGGEVDGFVRCKVGEVEG